MSRYSKPAPLPAWVYSHAPEPWEAANDPVDPRILELERANIRLSNRVEIWQWTAFAALIVATVATAAFLAMVLI